MPAGEAEVIESTSLSFVNPSLQQRASELAESFQSAKPFKHLCIDDFLAADIASTALQDFPSFRADRAINEFGVVGGKAVETKIYKISSFYKNFYEYICSKPFLDFMSSITGIPDFLPDPKLFGAGTHENRDDQALDPHVDFNRGEDFATHRRLNLLIYLNREWEESWGGLIELHSNPRQPETNIVKSYAPVFNRAVLFETSEISWHGFEKIRLPEDKKHLSRKSISIYLYTRERPAEEIAPPHSTFYVQRPLPSRLVAGYTLTESDLAELRGSLTLRDSWIAHYQAQECELNRRIEDLRQLRPYIVGPGRQQGPIFGLTHDGWVLPNMTAPLHLKRSVSQIVLHGWIADDIPAGGELVVSIANHASRTHAMVPGRFSLAVPLAQPTRAPLVLSVQASRWIAGTPEDSRDRAFILNQIELVPTMWTMAWTACKQPFRRLAKQHRKARR